MTRKRKPVITLAKVSFQADEAQKTISDQCDGVIQPTPRPVDESLSRRRITLLQHAAANRYHNDHTSAFSHGPRGIDYARRANVQSTRQFHVNSQGLATAHWREATKFITESLSADNATLLTHVIIDEIPASHAAQNIGKPARSGIGMLPQCLDALAKFYAL